MTQFDLYQSIVFAVQIYFEHHGKKPDKIFMSNHTFRAVDRGRPYRLTCQEDRDVTFMGIPVERYEAPGIEYYLGERGDTW